MAQHCRLERAIDCFLIFNTHSTTKVVLEEKSVSTSVSQSLTFCLLQIMASYIMLGIKGTTKDILERNSAGSSTSQSLTYCSLQVVAIATLRWESTGGLGGGGGGAGGRGV